MRKYIREKIIKQVYFEELDHSLRDEFGLGERDDDDLVIYFDNSLLWKEGEYMPIDSLTDTVNELHEEGATHVQICSHEDHRGYYITGVRLTEESNDEAKSELKEKLRVEIEARKEQLEREKQSINEQEDEISELRELLNELEND